MAVEAVRLTQFLVSELDEPTDETDCCGGSPSIESSSRQIRLRQRDWVIAVRNGSARVIKDA